MTKSADHAYDYIRRAILDGTYAPGDRLKEEQLVEACGVSRTPVREALQRLTSENYLITKPNSGSQVANWSRREIKDIFALRAMVEGMACHRAATNISEEQLAYLQKQNDIITGELEKPEMDMTTFLAANQRFHETILNATGSEPLVQAAKRLISPPIVTQTAHSFSREDLARSVSHHQEIIDALSVKDERWAEATMHSHIRTALHRFLESYDGN